MTLLSLGLHSLLCLFDTTNLVGDRLGCRCYGDDLQPKGSWFESQCPPFFPTSSHVNVADTHTHTHARFFVFPYKDRHLFVLIHTHTCFSAYSHTHARVHTHFSTYSHCVPACNQLSNGFQRTHLEFFMTSRCVCVCACPCVRVCVRVHVCICLLISRFLTICAARATDSFDL